MATSPVCFGAVDAGAATALLASSINVVHISDTPHPRGRRRHRPFQHIETTQKVYISSAAGVEDDIPAITFGVDGEKPTQAKHTPSSWASRLFEKNLQSPNGANCHAPRR